MKNIIIVLIAFSFIFFSCTKREPELVDLEINRWEQDIPNFIVIDSSNAIPVNPSNGQFWVYFSFNENQIEQDWDNVGKIHAIYQKTNPPAGPIINQFVGFNNGQAVFSPLLTRNNAAYSCQFYIEFDNGRTSEKTPIYSIITPPF